MKTVIKNNKYLIEKIDLFMGSYHSFIASRQSIADL